MSRQPDGTQKVNTTLRTSVAGMVTAAITICTVAYSLSTGRHLTSEQIVLLGLLPNAVAALAGNAGSILSWLAAQRVATAVADHVEAATGSRGDARKIAESAKGGA